MPPACAPSPSNQGKASIVLALVTLAACASRLLGQGTILWNEAVNGPFSGSSSTPTPISPFGLGTNSLIGVTEIAPSGQIWFVQPDFFSVVVPEGMHVNAIHLQIDKPNVWIWIGEPNYLSELAFAGGPADGDLLLPWGLTSIESGAYGMYIANHDAGPSSSVANYRLDFVVIPEPAAWSVLCLSGVALFLKRQPCAQGNRQEQ